MYGHWRIGVLSMLDSHRVMPSIHFNLIIILNLKHGRFKRDVVFNGNRERRLWLDTYIY